MRKWANILLSVFLMSSNFLEVHIFEKDCKLAAVYHAEQVVVNADKAYADLFLSDGTKLHVPFKYGIQELQVSFGQYFRSYVYDGQRVLERREPLCHGSI